MLTKLKNRIRLFFGFSASETNGLIILVPILLLILYAPTLLKEALNDQSSQSQLEDELLLKAWLEESKSKLKTEDNTTFAPTFFNPNKIDEERWLALGFKKKTAQNIIKYRNAGGTFNKKEDLLKIYGINKKLVTAYYDYIIIPKSRRKPKSNAPPIKNVVEKMVIEKEAAKFDINLADSSQLQIVRGIGPVLSDRIIKYRELLGGFTNTDQLKEVYGIKEDVYLRMLSHFGVIISSVEKISINQDSINLLSKHPYLNYKTSRAIVKYRKQHGDYQSVEDLKKIHAISDSLFQRIAPYLKVERTE
ncbi:competence protein ComEA helix-hairpin-helix repeat region [Reichenbachiella faecimaris]|uniref:Competence protein ComEA helix-hairpin-helix repeat region n=1 Tax=Reichenbachiella faecimaris TaxID=692418 RepID=A0A1W2GDJ6_REIFA|nr:helix-hairpin-helix domain-containing protein [Reichenbachiella faecimaris]SMD34398.1 competence protein ComEA helix-hairpin-helix repeat region [Reichenbachiella faecimaris]